MCPSTIKDRFGAVSPAGALGWGIALVATEAVVKLGSFTLELACFCVLGLGVSRIFTLVHRRGHLGAQRLTNAGGEAQWQNRKAER